MRGASLRAVVLLALAIPVGAQTTFVAEQSINRLPVDVEVTPNGRLSIVRGDVPGNLATDGLAVFDTATGLQLQLSSCVSNAGLGGVYNPSDFVRVTNSRAILVGGRDTSVPPDANEDKTYIDILSFDMSTIPPSVSCIGHHEVGSLSSPNLWAGYVNDVELTPDESYAIVNSQNWIHVIDMADGSIARAFNIGTAPYNGVCTPGFAADSVAATNDVAVVTTTRLTPHPNVRSRAWVYLIALTGWPLPTIVLEHELSGASDLDDRDFDPHDVVITPNGAYTIVSASDAVGVYDLTQKAFVARHLGTPFYGAGVRRRFYSQIVDSVETTDTRCVVLAYDEQMHITSVGTYWSNFWATDVFEIPPTSSPNMNPLRSYRFRDYTGWNGTYPTYPQTNGPSITSEIPHDLAIDSEEGVAVFKTGKFNVILTDLAAPDPTDIVLDETFGIGNFASSATFVSDSVVIAPPFIGHVLPGSGESGIRRYALTLGACASCGSPAKPRGYVQVIDLKASPPARVHSFEVVDPVGASYIFPADLQLGPGPRGVMVRFNADPFDPGVLGGRDFVRFDLGTLTEVARIGASGGVFAVDSLSYGRGYATSVGEDFQNTIGFAHIVNVQ